LAKDQKITTIETNKPGLIRRLVWLGCVFFVIAAALHSADSPIGGGDTWVAMACGRYTLGPWAMKDAGRTWQMRLLDKIGIHTTFCDPLSAKSRPYIPGDPIEVGWVNQNWLTHVLFYKMKMGWGENSIVVYKFVQAILTALFAYWAGRVLGAHPILAAAAAGFGMLLSRSYIDLRPNVSSILYAAILILLLMYWKHKRLWALLWFLPVMIIWSNVHGGFIYPIMILVLMVGGHLVQKPLSLVWSQTFVGVSGRALLILTGTTVVVTLIPAIFSPFGWENLIHPFLVATGKEGKIWRGVIEWHPIYESGFGNVGWYFVFLGILAGVFLLWGLLFFCKPSLPASRGRRRRRMAINIPWPKIDLAQLAVIGITLVMSIQSRRFVFLGGVVLSPFLAVMIQEIVDMLRIMRAQRRSLPLELRPMGKKPTFIGVGASVIACVIMAWVFADEMSKTYFKDDDKTSVFRRMVGVSAQPVNAMKFFDKLKLKGVVLNEWTHGGFVAFHQRPDPETGQPPCKLYMDGRAQAAYHVSHFQHWGRVMNLARKMKPPKYAELLQEEGVNVVLLDMARKRSSKGLTTSQAIVDTLQKSKKWKMVYNDRRYVILLREDDPRNQEFFEVQKILKARRQQKKK